MALMFFGRKVDVATDRKVDGLSEELQDIFYLAALAPSSHNIQSWSVDVFQDENRIAIQIDPSRHLSVVDPANREMYISLGCYTETLIQAFKAYSYDTDVTYDTVDKTMFIYYEKTSDLIDDDLIEKITTRHTDKSPFEKDKYIDDAYLDVAIGNKSISFYGIDSDEFEVIKVFTQEAYNKQAYDASAAKELSDLLRFSDSEARETKDGLPAEQLGITGLKKSLYYLSTNHESAQGETFAKQGISTTENQLNGCNTFVVISSENDEASLINCGRTTVNFWLAMVENGISVHPMSYALEDEEIKTTMMSELNTSDEPQMILRIGYASKYGTNADIRRDLADYVRVR